MSRELFLILFEGVPKYKSLGNTVLCVLTADYSQLFKPFALQQFSFHFPLVNIKNQKPQMRLYLVVL